MPQISQISEIFASQLFWLILTFGFIYVVIGKGMVPKIGATVEARDLKISEDLQAAERARAEADRTEEKYQARTNENRTEAMKVTQAAKDASARETEQKIAAADMEIGARVEAAEARIREARDSALLEIEAVAAEAAQEIVTKLSGAKVTKPQAAKAVKTVMAHD